VILPEPNFIDRDPQAVTAEMVTSFEQAVGRQLQPAQVERLIINLIAYREMLTRIAIQEAGKQCLLAFARFPMLDYLGQLLSVERLAAQPATTTIRFTLPGPLGFDVTIPEGTRVATQDAKVIFATTAEVIATTGATFVDAPAAAEEAGAAGNGYLAGQVASMLDAIANVDAASNLTTTADGVDTEDDERLRERIRAAPERFSVAGPAGAYRFHAMSAHASIIDVSVISPNPGEVRAYVLTNTGLPSQAILDLVLAALSDQKVRPLCDFVEVVAPDPITFQIDADITLLNTVDVAATMDAVNAAAQAYAAERRAGLGRDIVLSQIIAALSVPGVYNVTLNSPTLQVLAAGEWADCNDVVITLAGTVDG
jgi:phage-related baseplate assembly protein